MQVECSCHCLPPLLAALFLLFLEKAHGVISPGLPLTFSNKAGAAMEKAAQLTAYWEGLLKRLGSPAVLPPHRWAALPSSGDLAHVRLEVLGNGACA